MYVALFEGRCSSSFLSPYLRMQPVRTFLRSYRGTHPLGRSALSLLRCGEHPRGYPDVASGRCTGTLRPGGESVRADTLRAHPENAAAPAQHPSAERRYRPKVTSGCPKRSEGGCPVGTRTITAFPSGAKRNGDNEKGAASHTGDNASFVRAGSAEKLSLPRRTQPESAHARGRRQPDRG